MRAWLAMLLLASAGCLSFDYEYENDSPYGSFDVEGRLAAGSIWDDTASTVIKVPDAVVEPVSDAILPEPGGGQEHTLEIPAIEATFEVRALDVGGVLDWYVFTVTRNPFVESDALRFSVRQGDPVARLDANDTFSTTVDGPGIYAVIAFGNEGRSDIFYASVDIAWEVEGEVYPSRDPNTAPPQGYDEMTDRYVVDLPHPLPGFRITTTAVQDDRLFTGNDIDVGLWAADGTPISCGGDDTATETLTDVIRVTVDDVAFAIGAMPDACGQNWRYENNGPVRYAATLQTSYVLGV